MAINFGCFRRCSLGPPNTIDPTMWARHRMSARQETKVFHCHLHFSKMQKISKPIRSYWFFHWGFQRARLAPPSWNFQPMRLVCFNPSQASSTPGWPKTRSTKSPVECFGLNCYHHNIWSIFFVWDWCNFYQWYPITLHTIFQVYGIYTNYTNPVPQHITVFTLGLMQIASMVSNYPVTLHMILFVLGLMQTTSIVSKYIPP